MLRELIKEIRPAPRFDYVIGHQDRASTNLSEWENMSTAADIKAKLAFWEATQENETSCSASRRQKEAHLVEFETIPRRHCKWGSSKALLGR